MRTINLDFPDDLHHRPGLSWSREERETVYTWLHQDSQLKRLLLFCLFHLGSLAIAEDAEDMWSWFCEKRLEKVTNKYDPALGGSYWDYLCFCLKRECWKKAKELNKKEQNMGLRDELEEDTYSLKLLIIPSSVQNPEEEVVKKEFIECLNRVLIELHQRNPRHYQAFVLVKIQGKNYKEAALALKTSENTARVWVHRAVATIRSMLQEKGY
jgi:RNA polymerase sigma factor (sigma-70 family)